MPSREIHCSGCGLYLGEIKDARLRKNISYLCEKCETARYANIRNSKPESSGTSFDFNAHPMDSMFDSMFDGIFGGKNDSRF